MTPAEFRTIRHALGLTHETPGTRQGSRGFRTTTNLHSFRRLRRSNRVKRTMPKPPCQTERAEPLSSGAAGHGSIRRILSTYRAILGGKGHCMALWALFGDAGTAFAAVHIPA